MENPVSKSISQLAMFAKHNMVAPFGKPPPPKNSNVKHRCNSEHTKLAPARGGLLLSQHGIHDRRCLSASKRMRSRRCCHWGWKMVCIYEMYDQIFHWVLLGNYGGFVSKWEGYPQFQWQFQWATLIKMLGRDMDPLRLVFLCLFML